MDYPNYGEMYAPYPRSTFNPSTGRAYFHNVQFTQENSYVIDFKAITVPDPTYGFVTLSTPIKSFKVCGASDLDKFEDLISRVFWVRNAKMLRSFLRQGFISEIIIVQIHSIILTINAT